MTATARVMMAGAAMAAGVLRAGEWWVDSLGAGDGTSPETPAADVQTAINAASAHDTIHIRGGEERVYTNTSYTVDKPLTLRDWTAKPLFRLTNTVDSIASRVVNIAAADVTLRNLRFAIAGSAIGENDNIVEITTNAFSGGAAHNVTIDGCEFLMTAFGGAWNQGSPVRKATSPHGTNTVVRNCLFRDWDYGSGDGYRLLMINLGGEHHQVVDNVFTNTSKILGGTMRYYRFSGNRIYNCRNSRKPYDSPPDYGGMLQSGYQSLRDGEISRNIVWNDNGRLTSFLNKMRDGFNGNTRIFNNTVLGADSLVGALYYDDGTRWSPKICNNLLINNAHTNIYGIGTASPFLAATEIRNNLWHGGANALTDPPSVGITPRDCCNVPCVFVNTTDTGSPDFLRPDGNRTPQVMLGIGGDYPAYIGAVEPKFIDPGTLILLR